MPFLRADRVLGFAAAALVIAIFPLLVPSYVAFEVVFAGAYAIAILGLVILTGLSGQISLGHGAFLALGGYTVAILAERAGMPYYVSIPIAAALCGLAGIAIGLVALRLEGAYLALATFALAVSVAPVLKRFGDLTGGNAGIVLPPIGVPAFVHGVDSERFLYYCTWLAVGALFVATAALLHGRVGRSLRALRDNETAAVSFGINPYFYKILAFAWSAAYAGIGGGLIAIATAYVSPDAFTVALSITLLIGAVLGGLDTLWGALAGGVVIEFLPLWAQKISPAAPAVVQGVALIAVMLLVPGGIAGSIRGILRRAPPRLGAASARLPQQTSPDAGRPGAVRDPL